MVIEGQENEEKNAAAREEIKKNYELVKALFVETLSGLSDDQLVSFVKLACGTVYGMKKITVRYVHKIILPVWATCHNRVTIGKTFVKE